MWYNNNFINKKRFYSNYILFCSFETAKRPPIPELDECKYGCIKYASWSSGLTIKGPKVILKENNCHSGIKNFIEWVEEKDERTYAHYSDNQQSQLQKC